MNPPRYDRHEPRPTVPPGTAAVETFLFVGGPLDGERRAVSDGRTIYSVAVQAHPGVLFHTIDYRLMQFGGSSKVFELFARVGMTADEVLAALLLHYHPTEKQT